MQAAPDQDYLKAHNTQPDIPEWPVGQIRYYLHADSLTPAQAQAQFSALSDEQRLAQSSETEPTPADGNRWVAVTAGTATQSPTTSPTPTPTPTATGTVPLGTATDEPGIGLDLSNEDNVDYYFPNAQ
jgi:hypothetical protein